MNRIGRRTTTAKAIQLPDTAQPWQMISFRFSRASSKSSAALELS
jgi:hypothetical protein